MNNIIISTKRLYLKPFDINDARNMYELNLDPDVIKYTGDAAFRSVDDAKSFIENYNHYEKYNFGRWSTFLKENDQYIGFCGLKQHENGMIDIGFRFCKDHWNKGYATESAKACLEYGFTQLGMFEIIGRAASENIASILVLKKIGMTFWKKDECNGLKNAVYYRIRK